MSGFPDSGREGPGNISGSARKLTYFGAVFDQQMAKKIEMNQQINCSLFSCQAPNNRLFQVVRVPCELSGEILCDQFPTCGFFRSCYELDSLSFFCACFLLPFLLFHWDYTFQKASSMFTLLQDLFQCRESAFHIDVCKNYLGNSIKCRFLFSTLGLGLRFCISNQLPSDASAAGPWIMF